jgi:hypothetical protein
MKTITKVVAAGLICLSAVQSAHAGGWIADNIIKPVFGEHAAREADKLHERAGKPLDQVIPAILGALASGGVLKGKPGG